VSCSDLKTAQRAEAVEVAIAEALRSSETSVITRNALRNIPEEVNLHRHRRENFKSYILTMVLESESRSLFSFLTNLLLDR
jgi:2-phosphoglycerate kinase